MEDNVTTQESRQTKKCPMCAGEIDAVDRVCRFCGARFEVKLQGYCSQCHDMRDVDEAGQCRVCGSMVIDQRFDSHPISASSAPASQRPAASVAWEPRVKRRGSCWSWLAWIILPILLAATCSVAYSTLYHDGPPIPGMEQFFHNVEYELESTTSGRLSDDTIYDIWNITNQNDFAWPKAWIVYGDQHAYVLGRVEPGETAAFTNGWLVNLDTEKTEAVPLLEGDRVEIKLYIDFAGERGWAAQLKELINFNMEYYSLGEWHR